MTGKYCGVHKVSATSGAKIYYTLDGTDPIEESTEYTAPILMGPIETTLKAIAVKEGMTDSEVLTAAYDFDANIYVYFNSVGGSEVPRQPVVNGGPIPEPDRPANGTLFFAGWYNNAEYTGKPWDFANDLISTNTNRIDLYAKWNDVFAALKVEEIEPYLTSQTEGDDPSIPIPLKIEMNLGNLNSGTVWRELLVVLFLYPSLIMVSSQVSMSSEVMQSSVKLPK